MYSGFSYDVSSLRKVGTKGPSYILRSLNTAFVLLGDLVTSLKVPYLEYKEDKI